MGLSVWLVAQASVDDGTWDWCWGVWSVVFAVNTWLFHARLQYERRDACVLPWRFVVSLPVLMPKDIVIITVGAGWKSKRGNPVERRPGLEEGKILLSIFARNCSRKGGGLTYLDKKKIGYFEVWKVPQDKNCSTLSKSFAPSWNNLFGPKVSK